MFPVECNATALSRSPCRRASRNAEHNQSHPLQIFTNDSFFVLYVVGNILDGHCPTQDPHTTTPQFRQWQARRNTANCVSQMKQFWLESKGSIRGGAHALASAIACFFVGTENARRALELSSTLLDSRAFWLVLTVATQELVASEYITDDGSGDLGRIDPARDSESKPSGACRPPGVLLFPKSISIPLQKLDESD
mmetsp:Transcript_7034/g.10784  ORF Transcript_7034/g.10784 Transcript_7034/m.10784 type:complete len:195 (+) Transcript_7034:741-1325(+)